MSLSNRYEFMFYIQVKNGNPNGDPDMGNMPRIDPQDMHGYITDVAIKRRIRNYIQTAYAGVDGMDIIMQNATLIDRKIAEAKELAGLKLDDEDKASLYKASRKACSIFYDVRTFGAVLSTGPKAGQVRGPVQLTFAKSISNIMPLDIAITRMCVAGKVNKAKSVEDYVEYEKTAPEDKLRTIGRKQFISYGLYEARGFVSANIADETGFDENDLKILFEAILNMYEHDRSASKGEMSVISPLIIFRHVGTDTNPSQRERQSKLGCAAAHKLFEKVSISQKDSDKIPRDYTDYELTIKLSDIPDGVEVGFLDNPYADIVWGKIPDDSWITEKKN